MSCKFHFEGSRVNTLQRILELLVHLTCSSCTETNIASQKLKVLRDLLILEF